MWRPFTDLPPLFEGSRQVGSCWVGCLWERVDRVNDRLPAALPLGKTERHLGFRPGPGVLPDPSDCGPHRPSSGPALLPGLGGWGLGPFPRAASERPACGSSQGDALSARTREDCRARPLQDAGWCGRLTDASAFTSSCDCAVCPEASRVPRTVHREVARRGCR